MRYLPNGIWMQKADSYTIREIGVPSVVLMEHAAQKTIEVMERENIDFSDILIVCGSGNNGGDGFAIARLLQGGVIPDRGDIQSARDRLWKRQPASGICTDGNKK